MAVKSLEQFYQNFQEEILVSFETDSSGWNMEDFFTSIMLEYLEEAGEVSDSIMCPFRSHGLQLNAYSVGENYSSLDIFVSIYSDSNIPKSISRTDIDAAIKRAVQLYHKAINDLYTSFQKDNDTYEFAITLHDYRDEIKSVRICALTNGLVNTTWFSNHAHYNIWKLQSYAYEYYFFIKGNYLPIDSFTDIKNYLSYYLKAILCSYSPVYDNPEQDGFLISTHREPYSLGEIEVDMFTKYVDSKVFQSWLKKYYVQKIVLDENVDLFKKVEGLCDYFLKYRYRNTISFIHNIFILLIHVDRDLYGMTQIGINHNYALNVLSNVSM